MVKWLGTDAAGLRRGTCVGMLAMGLLAASAFADRWIDDSAGAPHFSSAVAQVAATTETTTTDDVTDATAGAESNGEVTSNEAKSDEGISEEATGEPLPSGYDEQLEFAALTQNMIDGFIAARPGVMGVVRKAMMADEVGEAAPLMADPDNVAALEAIATTNGFDNFDQLTRVENTIGVYFTAINPQTGEFVDPADKIRVQMAELATEEGLDDEARTEIMEIYEDMLATQPPLDNAENIRLVRENYGRIVEAVSQ